MALHTVRRAAEALGVSYSTLKQWISKGTVRTVRTGGGHHRISDAELDRLLTAGMHRAAPKARSKLKAKSAGILVALSGRNQLRGVVEEVRVDGLLAQVRMSVGGQRLTALITRDAADALRLRRGDAALAVIKATEVMVAREAL
jgi:molybdopterin-binding protein